MKSAALLFAYSLKRVRTMVITTGLLLAALQLVLIFVAGELQSTGGFDQLSALLPPFARELLGPSCCGCHVVWRNRVHGIFRSWRSWAR